MLYEPNETIIEIFEVIIVVMHIKNTKVKKKVKKIIQESKNKVYNELYKRLEIKDGEREIYRFAKLRERKGKNLNGVKCIKSGINNILVKNENIRKRWKNYFDNLSNV